MAMLDEVRSLFSRGISDEAISAFARARAVVAWEPLTTAVAEGVAARYPAPPVPAPVDTTACQGSSAPPIAGQARGGEPHC
jgi:hypothetical protein